MIIMMILLGNLEKKQQLDCSIETGTPCLFLFCDIKQPYIDLVRSYQHFDGCSNSFNDFNGH